MRLLHWYEYVFYKIYTWVGKIAVIPMVDTSAGFFTSVLFGFNLGSLVWAIGAVLPNSFKPYVGHSIFYLLAILLAVFSFSYFVFERRDRWLTILERFGDESEQGGRKGSFAVIVYILTTLIVLVGTMVWNVATFA